MTETIAFLGTGTMGTPMAVNLIRAGFNVRAWNHTPANTVGVRQAGAVVLDTPSAAVQGASVVLTMLYDTESVADVITDALDGVDSDPLWLQMTTVGVAGAMRLQELADGHGIVIVDAPVLGTRAPAEKGELTILAAGPEPVQQRCAAIFNALGHHTLWIDRPQGGQRLKVVVNSWVLTLTEAVAEAIRLASGLGIDPALFTEAISGSANDVPYAHIKAAAILSKDFTASFTVTNALKDSRLILDAATEASVDMGLTEVVLRHLQNAEAQGHGPLDVSAISQA